MLVLAVERKRGLAFHSAVTLGGLEMLERDRASAGEIFALELGVDFIGGKLSPFGIGEVVDDPADLAVHQFGQRKPEVVLKDIGNAPFAGLAVNADDRLVAAPNVGGIDWKVEHIPRPVRPLMPPGFLDGVLMRAAKRRECQLAGVGLADGDFELGAALIDFADAVEVAEIQARMDAVGVEVQRDGGDVEIAGPFAVAEKRAFDAVGAGEEPELGGGDAGAAVVVGVQ